MAQTDLGRLETISRLNRNPSWVNRDLYRLMYLPDLYRAAYERIKSKPGNMTAGIDGTTLDGFSEETITRLIRSMRDESFRFSPARRVEIPKANGKTRPLGIAPPVEKVVQEVIRMILEAVYESPGHPTFRSTSHGFRSGRGPHTALREVKNVWSGTRWIIEGDISSFFDEIDHHVLIRLLRKRIEDERFLNLIRKALKAGVMHGSRLQRTLAGTPQGSVLSPMLANVYLHELDKKVEEISARENKGAKAELNREYVALASRLSYLRKKEKPDLEEIGDIRRRIRVTPSTREDDPNFIRVRYIRYADDWMIGVIGPKSLAANIREEVGSFLLGELKLRLNMDKTHIRHATKEEAFFLGTRVFCKGNRDDDVIRVHQVGRPSRSQRRPRRKMTLMAPVSEIVKRLHLKGFCTKDGFPTSKASWTVLDDVDIIGRANAVLNGILDYYSFASNLHALARVQYILHFSTAKTLSHKHKVGSVSKVFKKYGKNLTVKVHGDRGSTHVVSLKLRRHWKVNPRDFKITGGGPSGDIGAVNWDLRTKSSLGRCCAVCGTFRKVEMHHVRHIRKMGEKVTGFTRVMAALNRKQIPLCQGCHDEVHAGRHDGARLKDLK